ncbi:hypothetical protein VNO78_34800 [Psophocarpus tetragonolobus]|uniref:Uncharacterized protein n=1 Tax=Psophocarpus tetragonolobus TaxID=3891 RepID=A0AAN9NN23_PSOTE
MDEWKRDGDIAAFGNWDLSNEFPITRYLECGSDSQVRYTCSSAETGDYRLKQKQERRCGHVNGNKGKVYHVREQARKPIRLSNNKHHVHLQVQVQVQPHPPTPKPVDEDLYKIPPELLHAATNKRKKMLGFISKCLVLFVCDEQC